MRNGVALAIGVTLIASPSFAQVRPADCQPVLPVSDIAAQAVPQDVIAQPAAAPAIAAKRRFLGLPFLLPAALAAGGIGAFASGGGGNNNNDNNGNNNPPPVSPA